MPRFAIGPTVLIVGAWLAAPTASAQANGDAVSALKRLSIEELSNTEVTSVSKSAEPLSDAAAAVFVITREAILNSGARSLPEILRLAPNLQVAQITASSFAISARGFNGTAASKLLVLIDGRSVYTPYHSGVSWDAQDVLPEDIERIEVISGPGATLWGANAVNGVINIITRKSTDTQGGSASVGGGNLEQRASVQYGDRVGDTSSVRAYVDSFRTGPDETATGTNADDGWNKTQGGFRFDWMPAGDLVTLQGDSYRGSEEKGASPDESISGDNVLARWNHALDGGAALQIQAYFDYTDFSRTGLESDDLTTYDVDVQHSFSWGERQGIVWGGGVRTEEDNFPTVLSSTQALLFAPQRRTLNYSNVFFQDSISLSQTVKLILGTKYEHDAYTGGEPLPNARLSWKVSDSALLWAAASKAVRAPSRLDRDLYEVLGPVVVIRGGDFQDEKLTAYEFGFRSQPTTNSSVSISTFYNVYTDLRSVEYSPGEVLPAMFENLMAGNTYGVEAWGDYQVNDWWRLSAGTNWLHENLHFEPGSSGFGGTALAGDDPSYQVSLRSTMNIGSRWLLYFDLRHISALPDPISPAYTELGAHLSWAITPAMSIGLTGSNLIHAQHLEFGTTGAPLQLGATGVETGRSVFVDFKAKF
ncbi:MAG TPA: TonB-dependent receptor [Steroidobacteraceae bacterium]|nr:TonB-dependent receptor [Steroidobacteraceae bacterium]